MSANFIIDMSASQEMPVNLDLGRTNSGTWGRQSPKTHRQTGVVPLRDDFCI